MTKYVPVFWDIETTGLNPMAEYWWNGGRNEVICVCVATVEDWEDEGEEVNIHSFTGDSEYPLIQEVREGMYTILSDIEGWNWDDIYEPSEEDVDPEAFLVGFNSRSFDHTFWSARCGRLRQSNWPFGHQRKRLDAMRVCRNRCGYEYQDSQDDIAEDIGIEMADDTVDGSDVPELYENGQMDLIENHARADVKDLVGIFMEFREEMLAEFYDHYDIEKDPGGGGDVTIDL